MEFIKIPPVKIIPSLILSFILVGLWSCSDSGNPVDSGSDTSDPVVDDCGVTDGDNSSCVNYSTEIQPIFSTNCTGCHGGSGGLFLTSYSLLMESNVVESGNSVNSQLIKKLKGTAGTQMPKNQNPLDDATIDLIETWIDEGAQDN